MKNKTIIAHKSDCYLLRAYNEITENFCYYIFTSEGDIIAQDLHGGTRVPCTIQTKYDEFSMNEYRNKNRKNFLEWLRKEGYK